jgi:hypothetical protein
MKARRLYLPFPLHYRGELIFAATHKKNRKIKLKNVDKYE